MVKMYATALGKIYTFGPTFRAENSHTSRHIAEFWMIEPEIAFADLNDNMDIAEAYLKSVIKFVMDNCMEDLLFFEEREEQEREEQEKEERERIEKERQEQGKPQKEHKVLEKLKDDERLISRLSKFLATEKFTRITYTEAINLLKQHVAEGKVSFEINKIEWGMDLQSEHERYICEKIYNAPIILTDYPKDIKAFYMRMNEDGKTVRAMDILVPQIGELMGGSQREERLDVLEKRIEECKLDKEAYKYYLDLRRFGTCPHSGFGLGFERLVMFVTGIRNIKDAIPFPRYPKHADF